MEIVIAPPTDNEIQNLQAEDIIKLYIIFNLDDTYLQLAIDKGFFDQRDDIITFDLCRTFHLGEQVFQIAIDKGLFQYENSYSKLMYAAQAGSLKYVRQLLPFCIVEETKVDCTSIALMNACEYGHLEVVKYLAEQSADINYKDRCGFRPILKAAMNGHLDVIKYLVEQGADLNVKSTYSGIIVHAIEHYDLVEYLIEKGLDIHEDYSILHAAMTGNIEIVELLLRNGADVNSQDEAGDTALLNSIIINCPSMLKFLIDNGANVNTNSYHNGNTALIYAAQRGQFEIVRILVESGADINMRNNSKMTALGWSLKNKHLHIANYLKDSLS